MELLSNEELKSIDGGLYPIVRKVVVFIGDCVGQWVTAKQKGMDEDIANGVYCD